MKQFSLHRVSWPQKLGLEDFMQWRYDTEAQFSFRILFLTESSADYLSNYAQSKQNVTTRREDLFKKQSLLCHGTAIINKDTGNINRPKVDAQSSTHSWRTSQHPFIKLLRINALLSKYQHFVLQSFMNTSLFDDGDFLSSVKKKRTNKNLRKYKITKEIPVSLSLSQKF